MKDFEMKRERAVLMHDFMTGTALSEEKVSKSSDAAMGNGMKSNGDLNPGVSIRFGPVGDEDVDMDDVADGVNGHSAGKRKARVSVGRKSYAEAESSEDDKPLVRIRTLERKATRTATNH
jgi:DNA topoisomerase-1